MNDWMWWRLPTQDAGSLSITCDKGAEEWVGWIQGAVLCVLVSAFSLFACFSRTMMEEEYQRGVEVGDKAKGEA